MRSIHFSFWIHTHCIAQGCSEGLNRGLQVAFRSGAVTEPLTGGLTTGFVLATMLIKLMTMVSIVFTPFVVKFSPVIQEWLHIVTK